MHFITGRHLKAARALVGLSQRELTAAAGIHFNSVKYHEEKPGPLTGYAVDKMAAVFAAHGVSANNAGALSKAA